MKCPKCKIDMVKGIAIEASEPNYCGCLFTIPKITAETLKIIECMKCPICGYSDDDTLH
jgi:hypothetical protein